MPRVAELARLPWDRGTKVPTTLKGLRPAARVGGTVQRHRSDTGPKARTYTSPGQRPGNRARKIISSAESAPHPIRLVLPVRFIDSIPFAPRVKKNVSKSLLSVTRMEVAKVIFRVRSIFHRNPRVGASCKTTRIFAARRVNVLSLLRFLHDPAPDAKERPGSAYFPAHLVRLVCSLKLIETTCLNRLWHTCAPVISRAK